MTVQDSGSKFGFSSILNGGGFGANPLAANPQAFANVAKTTAGVKPTVASPLASTASSTNATNEKSSEGVSVAGYSSWSQKPESRVAIADTKRRILSS